MIVQLLKDIIQKKSIQFLYNYKVSIFDCSKVRLLTESALMFCSHSSFFFYLDTWHMVLVSWFLFLEFNPERFTILTAFFWDLILANPSA